MGWWRKNGLALGDDPADAVGDCLDRILQRQPTILSELLGAIDAALRRNPGEFVSDPLPRLGSLVAIADSRADPVSAQPAPEWMIDECHSALETIAMHYRDSGHDRVPTLAELLETFAFVLRPLVPVAVLAEPGFALAKLEYGDGATEVRIAGVGWRGLEAVLEQWQLRRDPDAVPQGADPPAFASWTRQPDLGLEVDWHAPPAEPPWIEVRGAAAGQIAAAIAEHLGGRILPTGEAALAELLTIPTARKGPVSPRNAEDRWSLVAAMAATPEAPEPTLARPLVAAGLVDSDWRVRMVAAWAVGRWRYGELADAAQSAALPPPDFGGLNGEDRHTLLALRDCAAARARGAGVPHGADPAKQAFLDRITALLDGLPHTPASRSEALLIALLRRPGIPPDKVPRAWQAWYAPPPPEQPPTET
ncbi:hypothetical protein [Alteraurantiacibacter aquimixticola]|uniref:Uncharacterized protein n=1 Tax=Alteraurantiacibacter aquimixticola TaxID=2489173 RepID=A0A4T3EYM8_9SPHN|nr:hypothetical protein [Alteraurantiacibacter aquimixticola]TIX49621.1 hypothetical protein E5222_12380 [Alteraurantiacibacter aquimixticola]